MLAINLKREVCNSWVTDSEEKISIIMYPKVTLESHMWLQIPQLFNKDYGTTASTYRYWSSDHMHQKETFMIIVDQISKGPSIIGHSSKATLIFATLQVCVKIKFTLGNSDIFRKQSLCNLKSRFDMYLK